MCLFHQQECGLGQAYANAGSIDKSSKCLRLVRCLAEMLQQMSQHFFVFLTLPEAQRTFQVILAGNLLGCILRFGEISALRSSCSRLITCMQGTVYKIVCENKKFEENEQNVAAKCCYPFIFKCIT